MGRDVKFLGLSSIFPVNTVGKLTAEAFSQKNELPVLMRLERGPSTGLESVKSRQRRDEEKRTQRTMKKMSRET